VILEEMAVEKKNSTMINLLVLEAVEEKEEENKEEENKEDLRKEDSSETKSDGVGSINKDKIKDGSTSNQQPLKLKGTENYERILLS
jgi:hypothetical protein